MRTQEKSKKLRQEYHEPQTNITINQKLTFTNRNPRNGVRARNRDGKEEREGSSTLKLALIHRHFQGLNEKLRSEIPVNLYVLVWDFRDFVLVRNEGAGFIIM